MSDIASNLARAGVVLFLLGLLNGFAIPLGRSPRLGLSAHLTAVQSGTFLIAISLLWLHIDLPAGLAEPIANALWASLYMLWLALCLAGLFGAGYGLPIAGSGMVAKPAQQAIVSIFLIAGIVGSTLATALIVFFMKVR